jgi:hypothetical protein
MIQNEKLQDTYTDTTSWTNDSWINVHMEQIRMFLLQNTPKNPTNYITT